MSDERDRLEGLEDLAPDDPRIASGPSATRAHLRAYRDFVAPGDVPAGARVEDAERHLVGALERELNLTPGGASPGAAAARAGGGPRRAGSFLAALLGPRLRPAFAIAALVIVTGVAWLATSGRREAEPPVLRGGPPELADELATASRTMDDGSLRLEWRPAAGAERYAVVFISPDLTELGRVSDLAEPRLDLRRHALPAGLPPGGTVLWRVLAMRGGDEIARSPAAPVTLP